LSISNASMRAPPIIGRTPISGKTKRSRCPPATSPVLT